jgi:very-short-patch-repair endonuclease
MDNPITKEKNRKHFYNCIQNTRLGKPTSIELKIINLLRKNKIFFKRNHFVKDIKHKYAADFFIPASNIIIEADGDYWHNYPMGNKVDHMRTKEMEQKDYKVLRFWEHVINDNIAQVENRILEEI